LTRNATPHRHGSLRRSPNIGRSLISTFSSSLLAASLLTLAFVARPAAFAADSAASASSTSVPSSSAAIPDAPVPAPDAPAPSFDSQSTPPPAATQAVASPPATAPAPASKQKAPKPLDSCDVQNSAATVVNTGAVRALAVSGLHAESEAAGEESVGTEVCANHMKGINWYARFTTGPDVKPMTVSEKARLAVVNLMDPFNFLTIFGTAAISIATNSHTAYGPGMRGWAEYSGVSFTQDMTGQFFGTFLIPAITHTDPHYHRRPDLSIGRRIWHCVYQTVWQRADNRKETFNYSGLLTPAIGIAFSNLYVPDLQTRFSADAERYGTDIATAPIDNFITEFVPSIAEHIHTHVVFLERIINHVAVNPP
jgi:hypothetical protein